MLYHLLYTLLPFLSWGKALTPKKLKQDMFAGLTGAVLVLPQGVAYAYIAGLPPEIGLYTAIVSASVAALFGSSFHMISGPTAALSIVVASVISQFGYTTPTEQISLVISLTFLVGLIQFTLGALRLGALVNFISHTVIIGFTTGAAILIATSQIKHLLGITIPSGLTFTAELIAIFQAMSELNAYALCVGISTLISAVLVKKWRPKYPNLLIGMLFGSLVALALQGEKHGMAMVDAMPGSLPPFVLPVVSFEQWQSVFSGAFAVALLGLIEAVSIARAISLRSKQLIDGNQEFIGQGLSNLVGSVFSCYPSSGSFTRSGANYDAGATSPLAAVFAAIIVALIISFFPKMTAYLPLPAMAGSVLLIAWNLLDIKHLIATIKVSVSEACILIGTLLATLFIQLEFAIYIGILLSIGFYLHRTSRPKIINVAPISKAEHRVIRNIHRYQLDTCPQLKMIRIDGSLYFGSVDYVQKTLAECSQDGTKHIIIVAKGINFMDVSGVLLLEAEINKLKKSGGNLLICSLKGTVSDELSSIPTYQKVLKQHIVDNSKQAISKMLDWIDQTKCRDCQSRIFNECQQFPNNNKSDLSLIERN